ncbi:tRNA (N(6)-L-threonylcarbamoyladenosine(37)-C(2))-methylthiotransferase MtaB [Methylocapsa sp. D3K7]|uniref:tRNA (N(6)-L-threonylcarbamoyladenosine(37)-C(2))- methylthiotransferase MtaB n=1 Tax=Methylocapsa sp. D3K7 TaxID=3041435 RepID=UPI00244F0257|nr:tRNA (N(6)-L-threonylcarbamoyladenosine(37)-C(2))-methylthiotransferase MtaB [Methylocapsa sp. D3K7]WGJ16567.1 tRNA (N(6)-L-threonylcarbamoyladenosine(37)-C(2))-methylthiotransferase MtaB [Methylocapsa sp. D3K7]
MRRAALAQGRSNLVIINSCAVTAEAARQARQAIRRIKRERPGAEIAVTGCAAQIDSARFAAMPEVSQVIGNAEKTSPESWADLGRSSVSEIMTAKTAPHVLSEGVEDHTRAFLAVQTGCDHRCTFCVIPFGRGPSRSVPMEDIASAARRLADKGFCEIVLTGVDLTSYGTDLCGAPSLGQLVISILRAAPKLERLRLSSIDCIEADADLIDAFAHEPRLMPHLHLSLQSGDDMILKRMKRRHSRADAVRFCSELRQLRPQIVFGADVIAGFPTETDAMFENTLQLIADCDLTHLHVFPFSARPGTPAAKMPPVAGEVIKARAKRLREAGDAALGVHLALQTGKTLPVLSERGGTGRTEDFTRVKIGDFPPSQMINVVIAGNDGKMLEARSLALDLLEPARNHGAQALVCNT